MDLEKLLAKQELCINDNPPSCVAMCPIHVDVKGLTEQIQNEDFQEAYKILNKKMPMAKVISRVCDHPCQNVCVRKDKGGGISIGNLEKAAAEYGDAVKKKNLPIPDNNKKVAIVGGGVSGLTCAIDLRKKGYTVTVFEKGERLGGRLREFIGSLLPESVLDEEIEGIKKLGVNIKTEATISQDDIKGLREEYEAVYIGTGKWEDEIEFDDVTFEMKSDGVFCGGRIVTGNNSIILSVSTGRRAAVSIDRYIQKKSLTALRENEGSYETKLKVDTSGVLDEPEVIPSSDIFTKEEAALEAKRCLLCECHKCYKACLHLQYEKLDPSAYIRKINHNERIILGDHYANKTINSCMLCGLCEKVCPAGLDMPEIIRDTRKSMVSRSKMPPSAHDFALKDMEFNISEYFNLIKHQQGMDKSKFLFFPGCQLCGSYPQYVEKSYAYLTENLQGGVGLYLNCCGAPGEWAGRNDLFETSIKQIYSDWETMGKPTLILACSTCYYILKTYLKDISIITLWEIFNEIGLPSGVSKGEGKNLVVHDSCTARDYSNIYDGIRDILSKLEYEITEPRYTKKQTQCCGYGGLSYFANKEFSSFATDKRIQEKEEDYIAYCAMCRDLFVSRGKKTFHILDLIFGTNLKKLSVKKGPTLSERKSNRLKLKMSMLSKFWGEKIDIKEEYSDIKIIIDEEVRNIMEQRLILESDIRKVIGMGENSKNIFFNPENGHYLAFRRIVNVTYWVEYEKIDNFFRIITVYSHRMDVQGE